MLFTLCGGMINLPVWSVAAEPGDFGPLLDDAFWLPGQPGSRFNGRTVIDVNLGAAVVSIGGAGNFDGIFLSGMLAVLLA